MIDLNATWARLWAALGARLPAADSLAELLSAYRQPGRRYHNLDHVRHCLAAFEQYRAWALEPDLVETALVAHDVVYDPTASDNEARSSQWLAAHLEAAGVDAARRERVAALIMATRHDQDPATTDAALVASIDLLVLASPWPAYAAYAYAIRCEYGWVDDVSFGRGRARVLRRFLGRNPLFPHPAFHTHHAAAHANLTRELAWHAGGS